MKSRTRDITKNDKVKSAAKPQFDLESTPDLPGEYGRTHVVLLMRDPLWGFAFWEITHEDIAAMRTRLGQELWLQSRMVLRVFDFSDDKNSDNAPSFDISLPDDFRIASWYIRFPSTGRTYAVEVGRLSDDGDFYSYVRSDSVIAPADDYSARIDHTWEVINQEYEELLGGELERIRRLRSETIRTARDLNIEREREFRQKVLRNYLEKALSSSSVIVPGVGISYPEDAGELTPGSSEGVIRPGASEALLRPGASEGILMPGASEIPLRPGASEIAVKPGASEAAYAPVLGVPIAAEIPLRPGASEIPLRPGASETAVKPGASEALFIPLAPEKLKPGASESIFRNAPAALLRPGASEIALKPGASETLLKPGASEIALKPGASEGLLKPGASEGMMKPGASEVALKPGASEGKTRRSKRAGKLVPKRDPSPGQGPSGTAEAAIPQSHDSSGATVFGDASVWASVNVEVVLYGEAAPGSTVSIAGVETLTGEDGRYSIRLALPASVQELPVSVTSPDGGKIEFTTTIERRDTRRNG